MSTIETTDYRRGCPTHESDEFKLSFRKDATHKDGTFSSPFVMTNQTYAQHAKLYCDWMKAHPRGPIEALAVLHDDPSEIFAHKTFGAHDEEQLAKWIRTMDQLGCCVMLPVPGTVVV